MGKWITLGILLLIIVLLVVFRNKLTGLFTKTDTTGGATNGGTATNGGGSATPDCASATLDRNKTLAQGSTGCEVKTLQLWLGVSVDGQFGPLTKNALLSTKCVDRISLNDYPNVTCNGNNPYHQGNGTAQDDDDSSIWDYLGFGQLV